MLYMRHCLVCDTEFPARQANHRLCSIRCRLKFYKNDAIGVSIITPELHYEIPSDLRPIDIRVRGTNSIRCESPSPASVGGNGQERGQDTGDGVVREPTPA